MPLPTQPLPSYSTLPGAVRGTVEAIVAGYQIKLNEGNPAEAVALCDKLATIVKGLDADHSATAWEAFVAAARKLALTVTPAPGPKLPVFPTKAARLAFFREKLGTSHSWAVRALLVIYRYQTAAEKAAKQTTDANGVGFGGLDAEILSSFAKRAQAHFNNLYTKKDDFVGALSPKQFAVLFKRMPKYADQLLRHLEAEGKAPLVVKPMKKPEVA